MIVVNETQQFVRTARTAYRRMVALQKTIPDEHSLESPEDDEGMERFRAAIRVKEEVAREAAIAVVFAAIAVESWINWFGVHHSSKNEFNQYLDKLDLRAKWIVIPRYFGLKGISKDGQAFEGLKALVGARNDLAHPKVRLVEPGNVRGFRYTPHEDAKNAIETLDRIAEELGPIGAMLRVEEE